ncbi:hypothetical protein BHE74_00049535, partial [Ensete ventricosum]
MWRTSTGASAKYGRLVPTEPLALIITRYLVGPTRRQRNLSAVGDPDGSRLLRTWFYVVGAFPTTTVIPSLANAALNYVFMMHKSYPSQRKTRSLNPSCRLRGQRHPLGVIILRKTFKAAETNNVSLPFCRGSLYAGKRRLRCAAEKHTREPGGEACACMKPRFAKRRLPFSCHKERVGAQVGGKGSRVRLERSAARVVGLMSGRNVSGRVGSRRDPSGGQVSLVVDFAAPLLRRGAGAFIATVIGYPYLNPLYSLLLIILLHLTTSFVVLAARHVPVAEGCRPCPP